MTVSEPDASRVESGSSAHERRILWGRLPDQRPGRELYWLSLMPDTHVTEIGSPRTHDESSGIAWEPREIRRPIKRFVEAGAFGWLRGLETVDPSRFDWVASLELIGLVTGQLGRFAAHHHLRQAVLTWENMPDQPLYRVPPYSAAARRALGADLMLCPIEAARDHLEVLGFPAERIKVVAPGVDHVRFRPAAELGVHPEPGLIAFISPVAPNKGIDRVLEAFALVRARMPEARLVVAGRGSLVGLVKEHESRSRGAVRYLGALPPAEVARVLASAQVFTTAPRASWKWNEQFGLAYLEAMAAGIPIVTTVCGSNHEAVRPPNLRVGDTPDALAEGLLHYLQDPSESARVGALNRQVVLTHHDLRHQAELMGRAFTEVEDLPLRRRDDRGRAQ